MLSRVAENLYWISRYIERAENVARLLDDAFHLELDAASLLSDRGGQSPLHHVLTILACKDGFQRRHGSQERHEMLRFLTFERQHAQSILAMIARARENARGIQETLSSEAWSELNQLYLALSRSSAQQRFEASPYRFYERIKRACILFNGLVDSTMPRTEAFHFLQVGRYLERTDMVSRILNVWLHTAAEREPNGDLSLRTVYWTSLLRSCSAYEAYLKEYHDQIDPENIVRYLVLDDDFPRAMRFCVARSFESLREITGSGDDESYSSEAERLLGRLDSGLRYTDVSEIFGRGLSNFLTDVQDACNRISAEVQHAYFLS
jgi:uncharacterized alpha-E superfamily protein